MSHYFRIVGWTLLAMTIIHGPTGVRWRKLHALGLALATASFTCAEGC